MHMQLEQIDMAKSAMMTVRLTPEVSEKLDALARDTKRSKSYLASEAIASYVDRNAWQIEEIKRGLEEARSGTRACRTRRWRSGSAHGTPIMSCPGRRRENHRPYGDHLARGCAQQP